MHQGCTDAKNPCIKAFKKRSDKSLLFNPRCCLFDPRTYLHNFALHFADTSHEALAPTALRYITPTALPSPPSQSPRPGQRCPRIAPHRPPPMPEDRPSALASDDEDDSPLKGGSGRPAAPAASSHNGKLWGQRCDPLGHAVQGIIAARPLV